MQSKSDIRTVKCNSMKQKKRSIEKIIEYVKSRKIKIEGIEILILGLWFILKKKINADNFLIKNKNYF